MSSSGPSEDLVGSVLFTDLVGFTAYTSAVGDPQALQALEAQTAMANTVLTQFDDARIVKELGDGLMIWIGSADQALVGAVDLLRSVDAARDIGSFPLAVRMGLHRGTVVARGDDVVGRTVNIAARIVALAGPGELLVSDSAVQECGDIGSVGELHPVGPVTVKGVDEPIWLQRLEPALSEPTARRGVGPEL